MNKIEKKLVDKYGRDRGSIKDLGEAINLLSVYGEGECELCIHNSIRAEAYKEFKKIEKKPST